MTTHAPRPILVGLDGSNHGAGALDWAIAEAASRKLPLHLVHALETGVTVWSPMMVVPTDLGDQRWILEAALQRVSKSAPELSVTSAITSGPASVALEDASAEADTLVVGARGRGVVGSILLGSTSLHVVNHARCPVVVVREEPSDAETRPARRVVVGFDGSHLSDDALEYAFAAASHRHLPLDIVIAWDPRGAGHVPASAVDRRGGAGSRQPPPSGAGCRRRCALVREVPGRRHHRPRGDRCPGTSTGRPVH